MPTAASLPFYSSESLMLATYQLCKLEAKIGKINRILLPRMKGQDISKHIIAYL